jgi:hypothetical protein
MEAVKQSALPAGYVRKQKHVVGFIAGVPIIDRTAFDQIKYAPASVSEHKVEQPASGAKEQSTYSACTDTELDSKYEDLKKSIDPKTMPDLYLDMQAFEHMLKAKVSVCQKRSGMRKLLQAYDTYIKKQKEV